MIATNHHKSWHLYLASFAFVTGCGAEGDLGAGAPTAELGQAEQAVGNCGSDDSDSLVASLAVAIASELGHWDVVSEFYVNGSKLDFTNTGLIHCGTGGVNCPNVVALLKLQDDATSIIHNHFPSNYRTKLTSWYKQQKTQLTALVDQMLHVDQGVFQIRNKNSGKLLAPQSGSSSSGAIVQQSSLYDTSTASQWRVLLNGTSRQLQNVKSGLCMDLQSATTGTTNIVQKACSTSSTQLFRLAQQSAGTFWVRTSAGALTVSGASSSNGATIVQSTFGQGVSQYFNFEPVGSAPHRDLLETATAVYSLKASHSGAYLTVPNGNLSDGAPVVQEPYVSIDRRFHWYITPVGTRMVQGLPLMTYQLINRRTGKCLDTTATAPYKMVQNACSTADTQRFLFVPTGDGTQVFYTAHGVTMGVANGSTSSGAQFVEGGSTWQTYNKLTLNPLIAGEPHVLSYSHSTNDGPCGTYEWYDITRPNGTPLADPADTFVQLIFAGGKQSPTGTDVNPHIAQLVSGDQVAIDPSGYMTGGTSSSSGSCIQSDVAFDKTGALLGACCVKYNGATGAFKASSWSTTTYLCQ